jgi:hypothetical protein
MLCTKSRYYLLVLLILLVTAALACAIGFISPDSWSYLLLAQSLRRGQGCVVGGQYVAIWPCGYPMAIALTAPSADLASLLISSKFTNFILLFSSFLLLANETRNLLVATFIIINPITLSLYQWTWSENLFIFACCGVFFTIARLARGEATYRNVALLGLFLLIGCLSRYFFGPFAVVAFLAAWLAYGRQLALRALPAFMVAGVFFIAYQAFNASMTGSNTGMERIPAPESLLFLTVEFIRASLHEIAVAGAALIVFLVFSFPHISFVPCGRPLSVERSAYIYFGIAGAGYLFLAYALRARTQYDLYDTRTIGYGVVFILASLTGLFVRAKTERPYAIPGLFAFWLFPAVVLGNTSGPWALRSLLSSVVHGSYKSPGQALADYRSPPIDAQVIFSFIIPQVSTSIASNGELYYGEKRKIISPNTGPDSKPETFSAFMAQVREHADERCVFDFNPFANRDDFRRYLEQSVLVDLQFSTLTAYHYVSQPRFDQELKSNLMRVFQLGQYVPCTEIISKLSRMPLSGGSKG